MDEEEDPFHTRKSTDWKICCLCQECTSADLRHPYRRKQDHIGYQGLEKDLNTFVEHNLPLPLALTLECLNDGSGIATTLLMNEAKYHNGCRSLFRMYMAERELDKRQRCDEEPVVSPKKTRLSYKATIDRLNPQCVKCLKREDEDGKKLWQARSPNVGKKLCTYAKNSKNWEVYARLNTAVSAEEAQAGDIHYHKECYTALENAARSATSNASKTAHNNTTSQLQYDPLIIAQLVAFIKSSSIPHKVSDLKGLYQQRVHSAISDWTEVSIHSTRFKNHLLGKLGSDFYAFKNGKDVYISHSKTIGSSLAETARVHVTEDEAENIVAVGLILRKYILNVPTPFNGTFNQNALTKPVAQPLLTLLEVMLEGSSSITDKMNEDASSINARTRVACTISQLICSNAAKSSSQATTLYQSRQRVMPFPLYVGLKLHVNDRQRQIIGFFHSAGISVSYDRVMEVRKSFARAVSKHWNDDGIVVPINIKREVFVTGSVDNIDESG